MSIIHVSLQMGLRSDQYFTLKLGFLKDPEPHRKMTWVTY